MATIKDFVRMCKSNQNEEVCKCTCPFFYVREDENCIMYITYCTEEAEAVIDKWAFEHPIKTYKDDLFEKFPRAQKFEDGTAYEICVNTLYGKDFPCVYDNYDELDCNKCWLREYEEEEE